MKRLLAMLLVLAMLASWLPGTAAAEEVPVFIETVEGETAEVDTWDLLEGEAMLLSLDSPELPTLAEGEHIRWIDRLENPPEYAKELYAWLVENSDGDGTEDALIDPTRETLIKSSYVHRFVSFPIEVALPLADYSTQEAAKTACSKLVSEQVDKYKTEAVAYLFAIMATFDRDYPEVFWCNTTTRYYRPGYSITYSYDETLCKASTTIDVCLVLREDDPDSFYDIRIAAYQDPNAIYTDIVRRDAFAADILSGVPEDGTVYDKLLYLNDWLTHHNGYNTSEDLSLIDKDCRKCISALEGRTGTTGPVCEGYARAFKLLCDRLGIPCVLVNGNNHMWNYVQVDGAWYAVDVTWNDPTVKGVSDAVSGYEHSKYLLCGASTVVNKNVFIEVHPEWNQFTTSGLNYVNGPKLSETAYDPSAAKPQCTHQSTEGLPAVAPTCMEPGMTEGKQCVSCGEILSAQEVIPAAGHTEVMDDAVAPTCTEPGLTEGEHCAVCQVILTAQAEIPALGHDYVQGACSRCGEKDPAYTDPAEIIASGEIGQDGDNVVWTLTADGTMTVSGTGKMADYGVDHPSDLVGVFGDEQDPYREKVVKLVIEEGITHLGAAVFEECPNLQEVIIANTVERIGSSCFRGCTKLSAITIPESVTSIGRWSFQDCTGLTQITFEGNGPQLEENTFQGVTATVYYPGSDNTWRGITNQNYGGTLTWVYTGTHDHVYIDEVIVPTCTEGGYTAHTCFCGDSYQDTPVEPLGHDLAGYICLRCYGLDPQLPNPERIIQWGIGGERVTWILDEEGTMIIAGTGEMDPCAPLPPVDKEPEPIEPDIPLITLPKEEPEEEPTASTEETTVYWYDLVKKVIVEEGVTSLTPSFFLYGCEDLVTVTLPKTMTLIGDLCFYGCGNLTDITFAGDAPEIGSNVFGGVTATAWYPAGNATWTEAVMQNYGGAITWVPYGGHTHAYTDSVVNPTCTEPGYTLYTCACGDSYRDNETKAIGHSWDEGKITKEPTNEAEGEKTVTCTACGETKTETLPKLDHVHQYTDVVTAPTCTEPGYTLHTCVCGESYKDTEIAALGHSWDEGKVTKEPTNEAEGEKTVTCTACGETKTETLPKLDHIHQYTDVVTAPTCTEPGYTTHTCACGHSCKDAETAPLGHTWDEGKVTVEPTEETEGETIFSCTACGETKRETLPKLDHVHQYTDVVTAPTCTEGGYTTHTCDCGHSYKDTEITALGHSWDEGKVTVEPTEETEGETIFSCTACGETKRETLPKLDHIHQYTDVVTAPTCTESGYTTHACDCGHSYKDTEIAALGHSWDEGKITKEPTEEAEGEKTVTCTACGETKRETLPKLDHIHQYTDVVAAPTCTSAGFTTYTCSCGDNYVDQYTSALGHTYTDGRCTLCGETDPNWREPDQETEIDRLAGSNRFETAFLAAYQMKQSLGIEMFDTVVVASGLDFADALSGSYLAAVKNAPLLLASEQEWINNMVKDFIQENLNPGGTVYILGGEKAVPASFKSGLGAFTVTRLAGSNRFETNLMVLKEAGVGDKPILVATGLNFADCLSASASKLPILLVYGNQLLEDQTAFLEANKGRDLYIIGGTGAVSEKLEAQVKKYGTVERLAGKNRFETSVMIAETFFTDPDTAVLAYAWGFPDGLCGGSLAAALNAPLILTMPKYEQQATEYIQKQGIRNGYILGGEKLIPAASANIIFGVN